MPTVDELAARLAALEARYPVSTPRAVPPVTIGELTDVPAPGSPIASAWAQEVSGRVVQRFASVADRDARYPPAAAGAGAVCLTRDTGALWRSTGTVWAPPPGVVIKSGSIRVDDVNWNGGAARDIVVQSIAGVAYPVRTFVTSVVWYGFAGVACDGQVGMYGLAGGNQLAFRGNLIADVGRFINCPQMASFDSPAGGEAGFKLTLTVPTAAPQYYAATANYFVTTPP